VPAQWRERAPKVVDGTGPLGLRHDRWIVGRPQGRSRSQAAGRYRHRRGGVLEPASPSDDTALRLADMDRDRHRRDVMSARSWPLRSPIRSPQVCYRAYNDWLPIARPRPTSIALA